MAPKNSTRKQSASEGFQENGERRERLIEETTPEVHNFYLFFYVNYGKNNYYIYSDLSTS